MDNLRAKGQNVEAVNRAEATLIARDAIAEALDSHIKTLPVLMKPVIYEVSEKVGDKVTKTFTDLFSKTIGANVLDDNHMREFHKDLYWLRDTREAHERQVRLIKDQVLISIAKWTGLLLILGILAYLGIYHAPTNVDQHIQK